MKKLHTSSPLRRFKAMAKQLAKDKTGLVEMMREKGLRARVCQNGDMIIEPFILDMEAAIGPTIGDPDMGALIEGAFTGGTP